MNKNNEILIDSCFDLIKSYKEKIEECKQLKELNDDLMHILKEYEESEKEESSINEQLLIELKSKFNHLYNMCKCCYEIPYLELVNASLFINSDFKFLDNYRFMVTNSYTNYIGNISEIRL